DALGEVAYLDGGECLDVETWIERTQPSQQVQIPFAVEGRMKAAHHMHFGDPKLERLARRLDDFVDSQFEGMRVAFSSTKRAELAREKADVGVIDVPIENVGG